MGTDRQTYTHTCAHTHTKHMHMQTHTKNHTHIHKHTHPKHTHANIPTHANTHKIHTHRLPRQRNFKNKRVHQPNAVELQFTTSIATLGGYPIGEKVHLLKFNQ